MYFSAHFSANKNSVMKYLLLIIGFSLFAINGQAQEAPTRKQKKEAKSLAKAYDLNKDQSAKVLSILSKRDSDMKAIEGLEKDELDKFRAKRRSIIKGTEGSIKILLDREQLALYEKEAHIRRTRNAKEIDKLKREGASKEDLLDAQYGIR